MIYIFAKLFSAASTWLCYYTEHGEKIKQNSIEKLNYTDATAGFTEALDLYTSRKVEL